jgi:hypothetical protein
VEARLANWQIKRYSDPENERPVSIELRKTKRMLAAEQGTVCKPFSCKLAKFGEQKLKAVTDKSPAF